MAKLIYAAIASLDGYVADEQGKFDWAAPDAEVHAFVNDLERPTGTYLYGRRMYEVMKVWESMDWDAPRPGTSRRSGEPLRRLCTRRRSMQCRANGRGSRGSSTQKRFGG